MKNLIIKLSIMNRWKFIFLFTFLAIFISEILVIFQSYYLTNSFFDKNLLFTGFVTPAIDAFIVFYITSYILSHFKEINQELENSRDNLQKFIDTQDNIVILTSKNQLQFANKKFYEFLGFPNLQEFKKFYNCISELFIENDNFFNLTRITNKEEWIKEVYKLPHSKRIVAILGKDFKPHAFSMSLNRFGEESTIISFADVSQTILNNIKLENKIIHDKLTGAYNREYFEQHYKQLILEYSNKSTSLAIALLDIDHFKDVNDNYGHEIGDLVLIEFVETINKYSRKNDILVRWGGEEFILILKVDSLKDLQSALEHLRKVVEIKKFSVIGQKTCSIGGTIYQNNEEITKTIKRADEAMYIAKKQGRNQIVII